jgi:hypothetical protein
MGMTPEQLILIAGLMARRGRLKAARRFRLAAAAKFRVRQASKILHLPVRENAASAMSAVGLALTETTHRTDLEGSGCGAPGNGLTRQPHQAGRWQPSPHLRVEWRERHVRSRREAPAPAASPVQDAYPGGIDVDLAMGGGAHCSAVLPQHPGKPGLYDIRCTRCGLSLALTSGGRSNDPRAVRVPCGWGRTDAVEISG